MNQWILVFFLLALPVVNLILLIIWACSGKNGNQTLQNFSKAFFKLNFIILIIVVAMFVGGGKKIFNTSSFFNDSTTFFPVISSELDTSIESKITFKNLITHTDFGITTANGEVTNTDSKSHSFSFIVSFYDTNKELIGTATGLISNIGPNQTKTFEATSMADLTKGESYSISIDAILQ